MGKQRQAEKRKQINKDSAARLKGRCNKTGGLISRQGGQLTQSLCGAGEGEERKCKQITQWSHLSHFIIGCSQADRLIRIIKFSWKSVALAQVHS